RRVCRAAVGHVHSWTPKLGMPTVCARRRAGMPILRSPLPGARSPEPGARSPGAVTPDPGWEDDPVTSDAPAPLRRRGFGYSGRGHVGLVAALLPLVIGMAACSAPAPTVTSGSTASAGSVSAAPAPASDVPSVSSSAAAPAETPAPSGVSAAVEAALRTLVASSPQPSTAQVRESLSAAGLERPPSRFPRPAPLRVWPRTPSTSESWARTNV
ncbi:MAG TPA: hypothetical protein VF885_07210, partial [Arthrobacter sp.]